MDYQLLMLVAIPVFFIYITPSLVAYKAADRLVQKTIAEAASSEETRKPTTSQL